MKDKHIAIRLEQVVALQAASRCTAAPAAATLLDPVRNVVLMDGYTGGPRGAGDVSDHPCAPHQHFCRRVGLRAEDLTLHQLGGADDHEDVWLRIRGQNANIPVGGVPTDPARRAAILRGGGAPCQWKAHGRLDEVLSYRDALLAEWGAPLPPGERPEIGCHHAEMNVICNAAAGGVRVEGAWLITTEPPCLLCAKILHHAGVKRVICMGYDESLPGVQYLQRYGVVVLSAPSLPPKEE